MNQLKARIQSQLDSQPGIYAVAFKDLQTGDTLLIRAHESFHAASTMKTPVLIEVFRQVAEGKLNLSDSIPVRNSFNSIVDGSAYSLDSTDDSETDLYAKAGSKVTLSNLLLRMITMSSNLATNIVIDTVDARNIMRTMNEMGAHEIKVLRGVEDQKAYEKGLNNTTTAYDLMLIFEKIARGEAVSPEASVAMTDILLQQHFNSIIPAGLPKTVKVAHKTGSITGVHHDSGIVFLPDGRKYVLVLLSRNITSDEAACGSMAAVSKMIYQHMMDNK